jgi:hypothetical protein
VEVAQINIRPPIFGIKNADSGRNVYKRAKTFKNIQKLYRNVQKLYRNIQKLSANIQKFCTSSPQRSQSLGLLTERTQRDFLIHEEKLTTNLHEFLRLSSE